MLFFNRISETAAANNKSTHEIYDKVLEITNGSFFLRCSSRNYPPNPHHLRGSAGREGDFLPRADHPGCPLSRRRGFLQTSCSKAREEASFVCSGYAAPEKQLLFLSHCCVPHPFSKRRAWKSNKAFGIRANPSLVASGGVAP